MPGMGWKPRYDEASKLYRVRPEAVAPKLKAGTYEAGPTLDQGNDGTCVGHGNEGMIGANPVQRPISHEHALLWYNTALPLDEWPDAEQDLSSGTSVLAGGKAGVKLGLYEGYDWAFSLMDLLHGLSSKSPAVVGTVFTEGMMQPDENGLIYPQKGSEVGGHCYLIRGLAVHREWVRFRNSWGPDWGPLGGDARIRWEDFQWLIDKGAEMMFPREVPV